MAPRRLRADHPSICSSRTARDASPSSLTGGAICSKIRDVAAPYEWQGCRFSFRSAAGIIVVLLKSGAKVSSVHGRETRLASRIRKGLCWLEGAVSKLRCYSRAYLLRRKSGNCEGGRFGRVSFRSPRRSLHYAIGGRREPRGANSFGLSLLQRPRRSAGL